MRKKNLKAFFVVGVLLLAHAAVSQTITLRFTGVKMHGSYVRLDSVQVQNVSRLWSETVVYPDTVFTLSQSSISEIQDIPADIVAYPNPFNGTANVSVSVPQRSDATLQIFTLAGQEVAQRTVILEAGNNMFEVGLQKTQVYILAVTTQMGRSTIKLINRGVRSENSIASRGTCAVFEKRQCGHSFLNGDDLKIIGYATLGGTVLLSNTIQQPQRESENMSLYFETEGALRGVFSVGTARYVCFSQGNLQYTTLGTHAVAGGGTEAGSWRFATNQWDLMGTANRDISPSNTGWIDLFGWGTSGWNNGNYFYQPYSSSDSRNSPYIGSNGYGYGPTDGSLYTYSLVGNYANADWGVYNAIGNGGGRPGMWRTLTQSEWDTILYYRATASGVRYARATVNGVGGLVLFPDNWDVSTQAFNRINSNSLFFSDNLITLAQWVILENAGCVFLPANDMRLGVSVDCAGYICEYWSSTSESSARAYDMGCYNNGYLGTHDPEVRYEGLAVRLVRDFVCDDE